jgi:hypothetical protein
MQQARVVWNRLTVKAQGRSQVDVVLGRWSRIIGRRSRSAREVAETLLEVERGRVGEVRCEPNRKK